jgi:hypothetical protein
MTEGRISPAALKGGPPVEPGGLPVRRFLQQIQLGVEGLMKIKNEVWIPIYNYSYRKIHIRIYLKTKTTERLTPSYNT